MDLKDLENGQRHTFMREDNLMGERECNIQADDPGFDGTDFAHPAWFRGQSQAVNRLAAILNEVLDNKKEHKNFSHEGLNKLVERLKTLRDARSLT